MHKYFVHFKAKQLKIFVKNLTNLDFEYILIFIQIDMITI